MILGQHKTENTGVPLHLNLCLRKESDDDEIYDLLEFKEPQLILGVFKVPCTQVSSVITVVSDDVQDFFWVCLHLDTVASNHPLLAFRSSVVGV